MASTKKEELETATDFYKKNKDNPKIDKMLEIVHRLSPEDIITVKENFNKPEAAKSVLQEVASSPVVSLSDEDFEKAKKLHSVLKVNPNVGNIILQKYPTISNEQLISLGLPAREIEQAVIKTVTPKDPPLIAADFSEPIEKIQSRVRKLTLQNIIEGDFLTAAAQSDNPEAITKLLQQFTTLKGSSTKEGQAALEAGFIALLENAHQMATKYDQDLATVKAEKNKVDGDNLSINGLENIEDINAKIGELKLDRTALDAQIAEIKKSSSIILIQNDEINEISKKFLVDSRKELTARVEQKYNKKVDFSTKAHKNLGEAIGKYGIAGMNFDSSSITQALHEQKGVMAGTNQIETRREVKRSIASAKATQKNLSTKNKTSAVKAKNATNLVDEPPALGKELEDAIKDYSNASKENKSTKKEVMLEYLYNYLTKKNAELMVLKEHLPDGELKSNLENYIKESSDYHIYRALGLKKGNDPSMTMQMEYKNIDAELKHCFNDELSNEKRLATYKISDLKNAKNRACELLQELGLDAKITGLTDREPIEQIEPVASNISSSQDIEQAKEQNNSALEGLGFNNENFAAALNAYNTMQDKSKINMLLKTRFQISADKVDAAKALLELEAAKSTSQAKPLQSPLAINLSATNKITKLTPQAIIEGNLLVEAAQSDNPEAITKLLQQFTTLKGSSTKEGQAALEAGFIALLKNAHQMATKYDQDLATAKAEKNKVDGDNLSINGLENIEDINAKIGELKLDRAALDAQIAEIKQSSSIIRIQNKKIKELSKKFLVDSRKELTARVEQEYNKKVDFSTKAHKNLGEAIGKYGIAGMNFDSSSITQALHEQKGVMAGNNQIETRKEVKRFIASAKAIQVSLSTKDKTSAVKAKKATNLVDEPPALGKELEAAIKAYETATKEDKSTKKTYMLKLLDNDLTKKNAELMTLKKHLPDGELKSNLENYIKESNNYHAYRALGLSKGATPSSSMQVDYNRNIAPRLAKCLEVELLADERRATYEIKDPNNATIRACKILQELGLSSAITEFGDRAPVEQLRSSDSAAQSVENPYEELKPESKSVLEAMLAKRNISAAAEELPQLKISEIPDLRAASEKTLPKAQKPRALTRVPSIENPLEQAVEDYIKSVQPQKYKVEKLILKGGIDKGNKPKIIPVLTEGEKEAKTEQTSGQSLAQLYNKIANQIRNICGWPTKEFSEKNQYSGVTVEKIKEILSSQYQNQKNNAYKVMNLARGKRQNNHGNKGR